MTMTPSNSKARGLLTLTSALMVIAFALHAQVHDVLFDPPFDYGRDDEAPSPSGPSEEGAAIDHRRRLRAHEAPRAGSDPRSRTLPYQLRYVPERSNADGGGSDYGYAVLLISYHKTGVSSLPCPASRVPCPVSVVKPFP